jgi:hypothetical protein
MYFLQHGAMKTDKSGLEERFQYEFNVCKFMNPSL